MSNRYIGIDLTDPFSKSPREITIVEYTPIPTQDKPLAGNLTQLPNLSWPQNWPQTANELDDNTPCLENWPWPNRGEQFFIGIDGPQGLAAQLDSKMRQCEREIGAQGKTPYSYPTRPIPLAGYVTGSVILFSFIKRFMRVSTFLDNDSTITSLSEHPINYCEVYPGVTWKDLSCRRLLPKKKTMSGKMARIALLKAMGITVSSTVHTKRDADDVLDAGIGSVIAYAWHKGIATKYGISPVWDDATKTWREGFIRSLKHDCAKIDFIEVDQWIKDKSSSDLFTDPIAREESDSQSEGDMTSFRSLVANEVFDLVSGEITTYGEIAEILKSHPRPVGQAVAWLSKHYREANLDFPDHRVLRAENRLQEDYPGGSDVQRKKLQSEGIQFKEDKDQVLRIPNSDAK